MAAVQGKNCGACMMCCKLPAVVSLQKPAGKWCVNATAGKGCKIYDTRPDDCRAFHCGWLLDASLGPEWKPDACKFLMYIANDGAFTLLVDPASPAAWRDPRFYPTIKMNAARLLDRNMASMVVVGSRKYVILPERDVEVTIPPGYGARVVISHLPEGPQYDVVVEPLPA